MRSSSERARSGSRPRWSAARRGPARRGARGRRAGGRGDRRGGRHARAGHRGRLRREDLVELNLVGARAVPPSRRARGGDRRPRPGTARAGTLTVARRPRPGRGPARLHELQRALGLDARWLAARECRRWSRVSAAGRRRDPAPGDHQVSPRALARALERASSAPVESCAGRARALGVEGRADGVEAVLLEAGERLRAARWCSPRARNPPELGSATRPRACRCAR